MILLRNWISALDHHLSLSTKLDSKRDVPTFDTWPDKLQGDLQPLLLCFCLIAQCATNYLEGLSVPH
jgi:hypothetical protein